MVKVPVKVTVSAPKDKIVQEALKRMIEAVFEPCFYEEMMGFRPNRGCHDALRLLDNQIGGQKTGWVLDADIKSFFDNIDHEWMMKFVGAKIKDPRILRLVRVMLKAGVVKDMGGFEPTEQGSGSAGDRIRIYNSKFKSLSIEHAGSQSTKYFTQQKMPKGTYYICVKRADPGSYYSNDGYYYTTLS